MCSERMVPESKYKKIPSSSEETSRVLSNPNYREPWTPRDRRPNVVVIVSPDVPVFIERVIITRTRNVERVTVVADGEVGENVP